MFYASSFILLITSLIQTVQTTNALKNDDAYENFLLTHGPGNPSDNEESAGFLSSLDEGFNLEHPTEEQKRGHLPMDERFFSFDPVSGEVESTTRSRRKTPRRHYGQRKHKNSVTNFSHGPPGFKPKELPTEVPASTELQMKRVDTEFMRWNTENKVHVDQCQRGHMSGETTWKVSSCITCKCEGSEVVCTRPECPKLKCPNQIRLPGECCPQCPEKLCESDDGRRFKHGAEWHMGDCTFCECNEGKTLCSVEDCQIAACKNPVRVPGQCCPVCLDTTCKASNGTVIPAGEVWKEGVCMHCYCAGGERKCAKEKCPYINCTDAYTPDGKCCQRCKTGLIDCIVTNWGFWSECPVQECGGGMRRRFRNTLIPSRNGGQFCPHRSEAQMCPRLPCEILPVCPVTDWTGWSLCTATCGYGHRMRSRGRTAVNKATMTSLIDCSQTHMQETMRCYAGACVPLDQLRGGLHEMALYDDICYDVKWAEWGDCSVACGLGSQRRHQVLIDESHPRGHLCHLLDEKRKCFGQKCFGPQAVRCKMSSWGHWTQCSKTCGSDRTRTRTRKVITEPTHGGRPCPNLTVTKSCKSKTCPNGNRFHGR